MISQMFQKGSFKALGRSFFQAQRFALRGFVSISSVLCILTVKSP